MTWKWKKVPKASHEGVFRWPLTSDCHPGASPGGGKQPEPRRQRRDLQACPPPSDVQLFPGGRNSLPTGRRLETNGRNNGKGPSPQGRERPGGDRKAALGVSGPGTRRMSLSALEGIPKEEDTGCTPVWDTAGAITVMAT